MEYNELSSAKWKIRRLKVTKYFKYFKYVVIFNWREILTNQITDRQKLLADEFYLQNTILSDKNARAKYW